MNYKLNLSAEELKKRTHKDYLTTKKMLATDAPEYLELADGDKEALKHLVKAAKILDKVNMQLDNFHNLPFKEYLEKSKMETKTQNSPKFSLMHKKEFAHWIENLT